MSVSRGLPAALVLAMLASAPALPAADTAGLAIPINLRCTTCDDFVRCTPAAAGADVVVYRLKEKTFWAQVATIGDYLVQLFRAKTTDERPLARYVGVPGRGRIETSASWRAQIDASAGLITLPDSRIDQRNGAWADLKGERLGQCVALKRRDGYALVREFLGRPLPARARP
jgi:hypothetical protein